MKNGSFFLFTMICIFMTNSILAQKVTILDHKDKIRINPLNILNSKYRETNLSITPNGKYLYFMTVRGQQPWSNQYMSYKGQLVYDGDIWFSKKSGGNWQKPVCLPFGVNTNGGEDEPNISPDGRTVTFQSWKSFWELDDGPYYSARLEGEKWSEPVGLGGGITDFFVNTGFKATDGMSMSPDGKKFIIACGNDYDGNMDLFMSKKKAAGWSYPQRLGISTSGDERSVFLAADGQTIYFASDGYKGFGGLDIFKAELRADGSVGEVVNLGAPFNTAEDDYGFILTKDGTEAYFIRDGDIYFADLTEADERIRPVVTVTLSGVVKDAKTKKAINNVDVLVIDTKTEKMVQKLVTKSGGKYSMTIPNENKTYKIIAAVTGYPSEEKELDVDKTPFEHSYQVNFNLSGDEAVGSAYQPPVITNPEIAEPPQIKYPDIEIERIETISPPKLKPQKKIITYFPQQDTKKDENPYSFEGYATNHLILLLDASGSMGTRDKMPLLKKTLKELLEYMRPEDRITLMTFSGGVTVWAECVSAKNVEELEKAMRKIGTGGSTKGKKGLKVAEDIAKNYYIEGGNNRIIMATDGAFDVEKLNGMSSKLGKEGIFLSVFGFGKPNKSTREKLEALAIRSNGNYSDISPDNIEEALLREAKAFKTYK
jgi:Mg-chelatase subunit ChlD